MKALVRYILASCYSFARRWVNPKYGGDVIWTTVHGFLTPISFIAAGIYLLFVGYILNFKLEKLYVFIGFAIVMLLIGYGCKRPTKKALKSWGIEKEFRKLTKKQRRMRNTFAFIFFFFGFYLFIYLAYKSGIVYRAK